MSYEIVSKTRTHGVVYISGDNLWDGGEAGWYHGELLEDPDDKNGVVLGNTVGPFYTYGEAEADLAKKQAKRS